MADLGALADLRVIEVGHGISAPYAGKLLADLGASVVKVEPPAGDEARRYEPLADVGGRQESGLFHYLNAGKQGVVLDLAEASGRAGLDHLLDAADVLLVNGSVRSIRDRGLAYEALAGRHPRLVVATITPFGFHGPLSDAAGEDITICALGAVTGAVGQRTREPLTPPLELSWWQGGLAASNGALLALFARRQTGRGQHVDISPLDVWATVHQGSTLSNYLGWGTITRRAGRRRQIAYPFQFLEAKDGLMCLIARDGKQWQRFVEDVVGSRELVENPRYRDRNAMGLKYPEEVDAILQPWFAQRTRQEIFQLCREAHVPFAPVRRIEDVAACEQLASRAFFVEMALGADGPAMRVPGAPYAMTGTPAQLQGSAPRLGQHTRELLGTLAGAVQ